MLPRISVKRVNTIAPTISTGTVEYQGSKQVVASDEIKEQILKTGIRKLERETRVSHHTIIRILRGERVRRKTLAKIVTRAT
jgi:hypothetical protein